MALDPTYITSVELQSYFVDKDTGLPLAGGLVYFWEDNNRNQLKNVFELTGSPPNYTYSALPNPLTLSGVGTFMDNSGNDIAVYYHPFDDFGNIQLYFIQVYAAGSPPPGGTPEFTREAWPNTIAENGNTPGLMQSGFTNEISNSQFVDVLFDSTQPLTINYGSGPGVAGSLTVQIAPDWVIEIVYSNPGNIVVARNPEAGISGIPTNPPYFLSVQPGTNLTGLFLKQRLFNNSGIWSATSGTNGWIATSVTLQAFTGTVTISYEPSTGVGTTLLTTSNSSAVPITRNTTVQLPPSSNTDVAPVAYIDIVINLPLGQVTSLTSVQVVGLDSKIDDIGYDQEPVNRQIDHLFHYYNPQLRYKEIPSYLVGWDFPLNPAQFGNTFVNIGVAANKSAYVWDQTIIYQTTNNGVGISRASSGAIRLTSLDGAPFAMIQYLDQVQARKLLNDGFATNIAAITSQALGMPTKVNFYYTKDATLPDLKALNFNSLIATMDNNGIPLTFNGSWTAVPRDSLGSPSFNILPSLTTNVNDYNFSGWNLLGAADADLATFFAVVISFAPLNAADSVDILSVGLNAGSIATRPAPLTYEETLLQCEQYYETSYDTSLNLPGTITYENALTAPQLSTTLTAGNQYIYRRNSFGFKYRAIKRTATPTVNLYSPVSGTIDLVALTMRADNGVPTKNQDVATSNWNQVGLGNKNVLFSLTGLATNIALGPLGSAYGNADMPSVWIDYQYVVDARLGLVT